MSLSKKLHTLRQKPRHVRERYVFVGMLVMIPVLLAAWVLTYRYDTAKINGDFFKSAGASAAKSFSSPIYDSTFGTTTLKKFPTSVATQATVTTP